MNKDFEAVKNAVDAFKRGEFVMVMDRMDRENECDLVLAGEFCTPEKMAFMIHWSTGIICVVTDQNTLEAAGLYPAAPHGNTDKNGTNFYVSTDFLPTTTTGVSAADRCETVKAFCDPALLKPENFSKPGHMFPLCARPNGLRERDGHTESAYDLCRLANLTPVSIIGEMMHHDGTMMRLEDCVAFADSHGANIPIITVPQLKQYAELLLPSIPPALTPPLPRPAMKLESSCKIKINSVPEECMLSVFRPVADCDLEIVSLVRGSLTTASLNVPVRIHSECFTGDILQSMRCDCGHQLNSFVSEIMAKNSPSVLLYVRGHEGRGIGLANKIRCYQIQDDEKLDTVDANLRLGFNVDLRTFEECWEVLELLGIGSVDLYTNNPEKAAAATRGTSKILSKIVPLSSVPNGVNNNYLMTKQVRLKHKTCIDSMRWDDLLSSSHRTAHTDSPRVDSPEHTSRPLSLGQSVAQSGRPSVIVVSAEWNAEYVDPVVAACLEELKAAGKSALIDHIKVPGAFDLIAGTKRAAKKKPEAIICIGVLIRGETDSYQHSCAAISQALALLNTQPEMPPIISGLLMYGSEPQANERLSDESSAKLGASWAKNALAMIEM